MALPFLPVKKRSLQPRVTFGMTKQELLDFIDRTDACEWEDLALKCHRRIQGPV